jgi:nucleoside-diphosphate-sugar epimerase
MSVHAVITGATGFIGSAIVSEFLAIGSRVTVLLRDDSDTRRLDKVTGWEHLSYRSLTDQKLTLGLRERGADVFVHCGWRGVAGSERNEAFQITENIPTTIDSVELASAAGCRQWIGLGSQAEYGNPNQRIDEDFPRRPTTTYGRAKLAAGLAALALCETHHLQGTWLRVFSTYGPDDAPHWFIPYIIKEFLAGRAPQLTQCGQMWDYLHVKDAAKAVVSAADTGAAGTFNLGSGIARPLKDYVEAIRREITNAPEPAYGAVPYRLDQVLHLEADISRLTSATGWRPEIELQEGIRSSVDSYRSQFPTA